MRFFKQFGFEDYSYYKENLYSDDEESFKNLFLLDEDKKDIED